MDDSPPPTEHVLRPHHLVLLSILMITFKDLEIKKFPPPFATHLLRTLLKEVSEVTEPMSHRDLMRELSSGPHSNDKDVAQFLAAVRTVHGDIYSVEKLGNFLGNLPALFVEKLQEQARLARRSIFGYFCRRCFVSYVKLSFGGLSKLREDYLAWCGGNTTAGYEPVPKDNLTMNHLVHKTQSDKKAWAKPDTYAAWEKAKAVGDDSLAIENIRRFFEQHFHDQSDSGYRQHALLNVVHMHYMNEEYVAAGKLLHEAIGVARTANDRPTLQHCLSLLRRLPPPPGAKPFINEVQPDMHPLEVLYDVSKLMAEENEQPLSMAFNKTVEALGLYDHWLDAQSAIPNDEHQWAQHAVQSIVWREAGCERLSQVSEDIVLAFTEKGGDDSTRLAVLLNRGHWIARQGGYNQALTLLLDPATWKGVTINDYGLWAHEVWNILAMRAIRRGQDRHYREYLIPRKPAGDWSAQYYSLETGGKRLSPVRQSIHEVLRLKKCDELANSVDHLLDALWKSEFLGRYHSYRSAMIMLADFGLEYGMFKRSKRLLEELLPQLISDSDREQRAVACFTLARCIIAGEEISPPVLREALDYLRLAERDFEGMEIYGSLSDVLYFEATILETLGSTSERDEACLNLRRVEEKQKTLSGIVIDPEVQDICDTLILVGSALTSR